MFSSDKQSQSQSSLAVPNSPPGRGRTPRKISAHTTKLESVDDSADPLGPLGPLGDNSFPSVPEPEQAPIPPRKESFPIRSARPVSSASQSSAGPASTEARDLEDEARRRDRIPPGFLPPTAGSDSPKRAPSVSVEQAAKPTFYITVGDPHKVGDLTSSHIVYQVRTKVGV